MGFSCDPSIVFITSSQALEFAYRLGRRHCGRVCFLEPSSARPLLCWRVYQHDAGRGLNMAAMGLLSLHGAHESALTRRVTTRHQTGSFC